VSAGQPENSLASAASSLMVAIGRSHNVGQTAVFRCLLGLSFLSGDRDSVIAIEGWRRVVRCFSWAVLLELGQHFSPGRGVELEAVPADGTCVSCGTLLGLPIRTLIAIL